jgi:hypothetical protein
MSLAALSIPIITVALMGAAPLPAAPRSVGCQRPLPNTWCSMAAPAMRRALYWVDILRPGDGIWSSPMRGSTAP